jgi:DNA polymerase III epsilon subunit-like protein
MDSFLRDIDRSRSKMQTDVERLYRHYDQLAAFVHQYTEQTTVEWARLVATHPQTLLLIIETTPVVDRAGSASSGGNEPIRMTAYQPATETVVLDQLLHPTHSHDVKGFEYHGLLMSDVVDMPRLADAWPKIAEVLENHHIIVFGLSYARQALQTVSTTRILDTACCLHNRCREFYGEFYYLSLDQIFHYQGIDKSREALKDSRARILVLAQVLNNLAQGMKKQVPEPESATEPFLDDGLGDLDQHPF